MPHKEQEQSTPFIGRTLLYLLWQVAALGMGSAKYLQAWLGLGLLLGQVEVAAGLAACGAVRLLDMLLEGPDCPLAKPRDVSKLM